MFPFLSNQIETFELEKIANSVEKELMSFKGGNDYFDNYPINIAIQKQTLKVLSKLRNKIRD